MKYIKSYKLFESLEQGKIIGDGADDYHTIKDICLELEDEGYECLIFANRVKIQKTTQKGSPQAFYIRDVKEVLNRIINFLGEKKIQGVYAIPVDEFIWHKLDPNKNDDISIFNIRIDYEQLEFCFRDISESYMWDTYSVLKDICLDLEDEGFKCTIVNSAPGNLFANSDSKDTKNRIISKLYISKPVSSDGTTSGNYTAFRSRSSFLAKDIKEVLDRINNFLGDKIIGIYSNVNTHSYEWYKVIHGGIPSTNITDIKIEFEKIDIPEANESLIDWKDIPEKGKPYRKLNVSSRSKNGYTCEFRCELGSGSALVLNNNKEGIKIGYVELKDNEMFIAGIGTKPMNNGVGKIFINELFDYFKVDKFYLTSSSEHPVWNKIATKIGPSGGYGSLYSITKDQLAR